MEGGRKEKRKDRAGEEMEREGEREEGGIKAEGRVRGREQRTWAIDSIKCEGIPLVYLNVPVPQVEEGKKRICVREWPYQPGAHDHLDLVFGVCLGPWWGTKKRNP